MADKAYASWLTPDRFVRSRFARPIVRFVRIEAASGLVMLIAAAIALIWANSPAYESYFALLEMHVEFSFGPVHVSESLLHFINDGLMAIFFFVVGLEIKRELVVGELRDPKVAALPAIAALGGMIVPALIFIFIVGGGPGADGWGVPMATDIAFSLGVLSLLGNRVPLGAKLFLLALAIADDIGAIAVIAIKYTTDLDSNFFLAAAASLLVIALANRVGIRSLTFYIVGSLIAWYFMLESGVHATIAGVVLGLITPAHPRFDSEEFDEKARKIMDTYPALVRSQADREHIDHETRQIIKLATESISPLNKVEHSLQLWSSFGIIPLFALANAGVRFSGISLGDAFSHPVALGVGTGLLVGKIVGVFSFTWLAVRFKVGVLPAGTSWSHVLGLAAISGIGFTVALFVTGLAFNSADLINMAKIGIFIGSGLAGLIGFIVLRMTQKPQDAPRRP